LRDGLHSSGNGLGYGSRHRRQLGVAGLRRRLRRIDEERAVRWGAGRHCRLSIMDLPLCLGELGVDER
jgi:hypothetical protein